MGWMSEFLVGCYALGLMSAPAHAQVLDGFMLELEAGPLAILQNDGRYGSGGTLYSADLTAQNRNLVLSQRFSGEARFGGRHSLALLYAPLDVTTEVTLDRELTFRDRTFAAGTPVSSRYQFEGYRATYLYETIARPGFALDLGGALQIRNAVVSFADQAGTAYAAERDIGLVPALAARARWSFPEGHHLTLDGVGLSSLGLTSAGGGILDAALTFGVPISERAETFLRVRYLTGGADVPNRQLYNWGQFMSVTSGLRLMTF